jgi:hypothetical protein
MVVYPLEFHRRSERQWNHRAKANTRAEDDKAKSHGECCPNCCLPVARPFVSRYLPACVIEHHWLCKTCDFSWTSRFDPLLVYVVEWLPPSQRNSQQPPPGFPTSFSSRASILSRAVDVVAKRVPFRIRKYRLAPRNVEEIARHRTPVGRLSHCLRSGERRSVPWAIFNHDSTIRSQTALSRGLTAFSDCWRHSSAFARNSSAVLKAASCAYSISVASAACQLEPHG